MLLLLPSHCAGQRERHHLICMSQPREVRLQCGHLFSCRRCFANPSIQSCLICRTPILASRSVVAGLDDISDLVSNSSATFISGPDGERCFGCDMFAMYVFCCSYILVIRRDVALACTSAKGACKAGSARSVTASPMQRIFKR